MAVPVGLHSPLPPPGRVMLIATSTYVVITRPLAILTWFFSIAPPDIPASLGFPGTIMVIRLTFHVAGSNPGPLRGWLARW